MFKPDNKILIVDDNPSDLKVLGQPFFDNGISCKLCQYDAFNRHSYTGVRVAFFDINLNPAGTEGNPSLKYSKLAEAIRQYINEDNGPFALIFWTSHKELIGGFKTYMNDRHPGFPRPFLIDCIEKDKFLKKGSLLNKIKKILDNETLEILFDFEDSTSKSAINTINQIYKIIPTNDKWGETSNFQENFEKIFSRIATESLGFSHAKENPDRAVYEALMPMLNHQILNLGNNLKWNSLLTSLDTAKKINDIVPPKDFKLSELNTTFHIDKTDLRTTKRGVVLKMRKGKKAIKETFNHTYSDLAKVFIPFQNVFKEKEKEDKSSIIKKLIARSSLIAIEISAACDYQQNKNRLSKYLYGIMIDTIDKELLRRDQPDAIIKIGNYYFENQECELWVNLNFVFGALPNDKRLGKPLFVFKKEIVDMVGNKYANHVSRIGITSF